MSAVHKNNSLKEKVSSNENGNFRKFRCFVRLFLSLMLMPGQCENECHKIKTFILLKCQSSTANI